MILEQCIILHSQIPEILKNSDIKYHLAKCCEMLIPFMFFQILQNCALFYETGANVLKYVKVYNGIRAKVDLKICENADVHAKIGVATAENEPRKDPEKWTIQSSPFEFMKFLPPPSNN